MTRQVYINGRYCAAEQAQVSIFDRGLLFADGIYEVAGVIDGKLMDFDSHMQRLDRSLREMQMPVPLTHEEILEMMRELVRLNTVEEGLVYMQITRGSSGDRDFVPAEGMTPTVFAFAQHKSDKTRAEYRDGIAMRSQPDIRWARRDIKTVGLMGSVFAKMASKGASEALLHQDGYVTEGGATSFYIVKDGVLVTRPLSNDILHGCTRKALLELLDSGSVTLEERLFTLAEVGAADEAFITGASTYVTPVIEIDGKPVGSGKPGPVTRQLQQLYIDAARASAV
ncbi:MAG: D-amino-acid transaminase [Rhodospirillales bacterium]